MSVQGIILCEDFQEDSSGASVLRLRLDRGWVSATGPGRLAFRGREALLLEPVVAEPFPLTLRSLFGEVMTTCGKCLWHCGWVLGVRKGGAPGHHARAGSFRSTGGAVQSLVAKSWPLQETDGLSCLGSLLRI